MALTMQDYIMDIPNAVARNIKERNRICGPITEDFLSCPHGRIVIIATGSSYNAALCALEGMKKLLGLPVKLMTPFYLEHYFTADKDDYLIFVSQSGYSSNVIEALRKARELPCASVSVTGHPDSDLAKEAERAFDYGLGEEKVGYVTKGPALLTVYFWMFAAKAAAGLGRIEEREAGAWYRQIGLAAANAEVTARKALDCFTQYEKEFLSMDRIILCGGGTGLATVTEGALKISETVRIPCIVCDAEELLHGWYYQIDPTYTVFFVSDCPDTDQRIDTIASAVREVTDRVFVLKNGGQGDGKREIGTENTVDWRVTPIMQLPFFWEIAYLTSSRLDSCKLHPLAANMKKWISAKTENYRKERKE